MRVMVLLFLFLNLILRAETKDFTFYYQNALVAYKSGDFAAARIAALEAGKLKANDSHTFVLLGKIALAQKNYAEAEKVLAPWIQKEPDLAILMIPWGDVLVFTGKPEKALEFYDKASTQEGKKPDALLRKVYALLKNKELGEAERLAAGMDGFNDKTPVYYFAKAAVLEVSGKKQESEIVLKNSRTLYGESVYLEYYRDYLWFVGSVLK